MAGHLGLRHQNTGYHNPQISVHSACLEKNQDVTHAGGPTLSNKISESFGMWCQNDQKCRLPSTETEKIHLSTLNNSPQAQQRFFLFVLTVKVGAWGAPYGQHPGFLCERCYIEMIRTVYLYSSGLIEPSPSSWFKPLSYTPHMRPRMGRCGTKTAQNRILKTKTKRKYALTDPFCCQRRQATSWLRQQNAPPQILVHCQCLEKNQDITHTGGPTLTLYLQAR